MATGFFRKQPSEAFNIEIDFTARLSSGESIQSQSITVTDENGDSITPSDVTGDVSESAGVVTVWVKGGTDGKRYTIQVVVETDTSSPGIHEMDVIMEVVEL